MQYICDDYAVDNHICDAVDYGTFIIKQDPNDNSSIFTTAFSLKKNETANPEIVLYKVDSTGYYCVAIIHANLEPEEGDRFDAWIEWRLPYGNLPASDYPKLLVRIQYKVHCYMFTHCIMRTVLWCILDRLSGRRCCLGYPNIPILE